MNYLDVTLNIRCIIKSFQMKISFALFVILLITMAGCKEQPPVSVEGNSKLEVTAIWNASNNDSLPDFQPLKNAKVILTSEYGVQVNQTDNNGKLVISGLPSSIYGISVRMQHPDDSNIQLVGNKRDVEILSGKLCCDTIIAKPISSTGIAINEIYVCGPVNNIHFFYDEFIELYNASDSLKYLDGMMVMRFNGSQDCNEPGKDVGEDGDIDGVTYAFKFPGKPGEKNYPLVPKTFLVLAVDAVNHKSSVSTSVDLSHADWEFYNQYSSDDIDNPNVPNLINMRPDKTNDFLIGLTDDVIVLSSGIDSVWSDGIDISTVIDGVEFQSSSSLMKTLDTRIDRGIVLSPPKYSGKSMQRREPGIDTNDGSVDWEITSHPTPGYQ